MKITLNCVELFTLDYRRLPLLDLELWIAVDADPFSVDVESFTARDQKGNEFPGYEDVIWAWIGENEDEIRDAVWEKINQPEEV